MFVILHVLLNALNALWLDRLAHAATMGPNFAGRGVGALLTAGVVASVTNGWRARSRRLGLSPTEGSSAAITSPTDHLLTSTDSDVGVGTLTRARSRFALRIVVSGLGLACLMRSFGFIGPVVALLGRADAAFLAARNRTARPRAIAGLAGLALLTLYAAPDFTRAAQGILLAFTGSALIAFSQLLMESESRTSHGALAVAPALGLLLVGCTIARGMPTLDVSALGAGALMYAIYEVMRPLLRRRSVEACAYLTLVGAALATPLSWVLGWEAPHPSIALGIVGLLLALGPWRSAFSLVALPRLARR